MVRVQYLKGENHMIKVSKNDPSELMKICMDIIETFEDFLDKRGIVIDNDEKEEDADASNIYGMDYAELEEGVSDILDAYGLIEYTEN
jgi:hypothetical protein